MYGRALIKLPLQHVKILFIKQICKQTIPLGVLCRKLVHSPQGSVVPAYHSNRLYSNEGDSILEPEPFEDLVFDDTLHDFSFKNILYLEDDPRVKALNECRSAQQLLDMHAAEGPLFLSAHLVQMVVLLWDFCRKSEGNIANTQKTIKESNEFQSFLEHLSSCVKNLSIIEKTCCFLYLKRIGLESDHRLIAELVQEILDTIRKDDHIPLSALSRFCVAIGAEKDLTSSLICRNMIPHLVRALEKSTTAEEIRLITICLINIRQLVLDDILDLYKSKVLELMKREEINTNNTKCILKVLNFLNHPAWSYQHSKLSRQLMLLLLPVVEDLTEEDVKTVVRIFQSKLEPAAIVPKLLKVSEKLIESNLSQELLTCIVQFAEPTKKEHLTALFKKQLADETMWERPTAALYFFTILRSLKISDTELCNGYWSRILKEIEANHDGKEHYVFSKHCHRYMYFNNNLGGTYRHLEFEKRLTHLCMNEINHGISGVIPSKFANIAPFVIGYGHTYRGSVMIPNIIMSKIESMKNQFSIDDCMQLSRGIQIALQMRFRHFVPTIMAQQFEIIETALSTSAQRHLDSLSNDNAKDLNVIVRALNNRRAPRKSPIFQQALAKYNDIESPTLDSRCLRNMSYNLSTSHFVAPNILEKMFGYIVEHEEYVTGDTAEKILSCSYNLGYTPQLQEGLSSIATIVMRDFDYMTGLSIIQSCLALCFYKTIPEELINKVFCVKFIKRIEDEIQMCYSKATYPERVLNHVMQLNRAVCLDFPEVDVPWFQQNFLEAQLSKYPFVPSKYNDDVKQSLLAVFKDESLFRCNHVTPYGYRIDFVIHFDTQKHPIPTPVETTVLDKITKVAILLLKLDSLCENDLTTMRGKEALKMRHLEMLGYKVVHINEVDWNHMRVQENRANYLKCLLQITS